MEIERSVALVSGANRGLGKAYAEALIEAGALKVYAGARNPETITDPRLTPVKLDITDRTQVAAAAERCGDVNLVINNAGVAQLQTIIGDEAEEVLRREMEVNVFGLHSMMSAFAPVLGSNGGGAMVNMLSVVSWFTSPFNAPYCASKHAALALTDAARIQLRAQGTLMVGVYAGLIDTDMTAGLNQPKVSPGHVAQATLDGLREGREHVLADQRAEQVWAAMRADPAQMESVMQAAWDQALAQR